MVVAGLTMTRVTPGYDCQQFVLIRQVSVSMHWFNSYGTDTKTGANHKAG